MFGNLWIHQLGITNGVYFARVLFELLEANDWVFTTPWPQSVNKKEGEKGRNGGLIGMNLSATFSKYLRQLDDWVILKFAFLGKFLEYDRDVMER